MALKELPGSTPLDEADKNGLILSYLTTREELNAAEFENMNSAYLKYLARKPLAKKAPFTAIWLKKLHFEMFGKVWKWAGEYRTSDIMPGVPVYQIAAEMLNGERDIKTWRTHQHDPFECSVKIHHRLVWMMLAIFLKHPLD